MLKRVHIKGYKSLADVEVELEPLIVLFGPNASGKSNLLDALQLLSRLGTSRTLRDAFDSPYRGTPLESFHMGQEGIKGLAAQDRVVFSIEADLRLSESTLTAVNRQVRNMRPSSGRAASRDRGRQRDAVRAHNLRYRIAIEMVPSSGALRVADEYLAPLTTRGELARRKPFLERQGDKLHLRSEGSAQVIHHDRFLGHSILSLPHYPLHHPHLVAARCELESWLFFYFEPRERMRAANPLKEARRIGPMGEDLAVFLNTVKAEEPQLFDSVVGEFTAMIPRFDGIQINVNDLGDVELRLTERGVAMPARVLSDGTLRALGLAALTAVVEPPALVGIEEPETGLHPRLIPMIAQMLETRSRFFDGLHTQHIVTTRDPFLPDLLPNRFLFVVQRTESTNDETCIVPFSAWKASRRLHNVHEARRDDREGTRIWERILRGDFGA